MRNKYERFYTLLGCQDNADCLKYLIMFKLIAPASSNLFSLKPANHPFISCIFLFSLRLSHSVLKSTSTAQAQLPVIYVLIFQKLVKFCYKINNLPPIPSFCFSSQVVDIIQKRSDFPLFCPMVWPPDFATLLWHCFKKNITC